MESTPGGDAVPLGSAASAENGGADAPGTVEDEGEDPGDDTEAPEESAQASAPVDPEQTAGSGEEDRALWWISPICAAAGVGVLVLIPAPDGQREPALCGMRTAGRKFFVYMIPYVNCPYMMAKPVPAGGDGACREARFSRHPISAQKVRWLENQTKEKWEKIMKALPWRRKLSLLWKGL